VSLLIVRCLLLAIYAIL